MANDKYILSNDYYVEIETNGIQNWAVLYGPFGFKVNEGPKTLSDALLNLVKQVVNDYTPTGRKNDTSNWINVPTVVREEVSPKPTKFQIKGRVIDSITKEGLRGVKVSLDKSSTTTYPGGNFTLEIRVDVGETPPQSNIDFSKNKYEPQDAPSITLDGKLKTRINVIELNTIKKSLEKETSKLLVIDESDINKMNSFNLKSAEAVITETINKEVNKINERLIPFALALLAQFGITALNQLGKKSCPSIGEIPRLVSKKNKLTRQLNNILKIASKVQKVASILKALVLAFKVVRTIITKNPIPTTLGGPGPIGVIFSIPQGILRVIEDKKDKLTKLIDKFGNVVGVLTPTTIPLVSVLTKILNILAAVDFLIGECLDEARQAVVDELNKEEEIDNNILNEEVDSRVNGANVQPGSLTIQDVDFSKIDDSRIRRILGISPTADFNIQDLLSGTYLQVQLDEELTNITKESADAGETIQTEYNGFILAVETQEGETNKDLKRRYAVGKDTNGVVVVKGEPSYASSDQILINELIFTIDKNDLKPN